MNSMDETLSIIFEKIETHLETRRRDQPSTVISRANSNVSEPSERSDSLTMILHQRARDLKIQEEDSETERLERALLENRKKRVERQRQLRRLRDEAELETATNSDDEGTLFSSVSESKTKVVAESHDGAVQTDSWIADRKQVVQPLSACNPLIGLLPQHEIKPFDGNPLEWCSFISAFKDLVHDVITSDSQRVSMLRLQKYGKMLQVR